MANFEIEAHLSLVDDLPLLRHAHPAGTYQVFLRNLGSEPGKSAPLLSAMVIFEASDINEAKDQGSLYLRDFMDYLTVVTSSTFKLHRVLQVFNWEPIEAAADEPSMREALYFLDVPYHDLPISALNDELLETVRLMQNHEVEPRLRRCLKWFRLGVLDGQTDSQFVYFWLVIEILAQVIKDVSPVPDKCPTCSTPLICPTCNASPVHKPFARQAIQQLFEKFVIEEWQPFFETCIDVRNRLTHGDEPEAIEEAMGIELADVVNTLGKLAWSVIMNQFIPGLAGLRPAFVQTNRYVHMKMTAVTQLFVGYHPNFDEPDPESVPKFTISVDIHDPPERQDAQH